MWASKVLPEYGVRRLGAFLFEFSFAVGNRRLDILKTFWDVAGSGFIQVHFKLPALFCKNAPLLSYHAFYSRAAASLPLLFVGFLVGKTFF